MPFVLRCPDCRGKFPWTLDQRHPRFCPLCRADMGEERADDDVVMPSFLSAKTKANDDLYRQTERGSEVRMEEAAKLAGCATSDMSALKITDMNDRRDAEIAAKLPSNPVSDFMQQNPNVAGFRGADGLGYSGAVQSGPMPNAGAKTRTMLQNHHAELSRGSAVSERPALETVQPGYRRRG